MPALLGILNKTTSGYFPYVKSTKNTARYASLLLRPGQARLFEKRGIMGQYVEVSEEDGLIFTPNESLE